MSKIRPRAHTARPKMGPPIKIQGMIDTNFWVVQGPGVGEIGAPKDGLSMVHQSKAMSEFNSS